MDDSKVRKVFARLLTKAGLAQRNLHFLRHTFASLLIQQGESLAYVKEQMGHSSIDVTVDTYGHLVPGGNARQWTNLTTAPKFLTNLVWKQNGNILSQKLLRKKKLRCKLLKKLEPPAGVEPATY